MKSLKFASLIAFALCAVVASASIVTYTGSDPGVGPGGARPNSDAAAAAFLGAITPAGTITFEGLPLGYASPLSLGGGVTLTLSGMDTSGAGIRNDAVTDTGYNTTSGGSEYLGIWPPFNSGANADATFSFASPIDSFGAYITGTETDLPGDITVNFTDGSIETLALTKTPDGGGVLYFGFTDAGASISSVTFTEGPTGSSRDIWGIDDVTFGATVPEPGSILLFGTGLAGLAGVIRRKMK